MPALLWSARQLVPHPHQELGRSYTLGARVSLPSSSARLRLPYFPRWLRRLWDLREVMASAGATGPSASTASGGSTMGGGGAVAGRMRPACCYTGHRNQRNFVGLSVSPDGHILCGSEDNSGEAAAVAAVGSGGGGCQRTRAPRHARSPGCTQALRHAFEHAPGLARCGAGGEGHAAAPPRSTPCAAHVVFTSCPCAPHGLQCTRTTAPCPSASRSIALARPTGPLPRATSRSSAPCAGPTAAGTAWRPTARACCRS